MEKDLRGALNTDKRIWAKEENNYYSPSIWVTKEGAIVIKVGGNCVVKSVEEWHKLALLSVPVEPIEWPSKNPMVGFPLDEVARAENRMRENCLLAHNSISAEKEKEIAELRIMLNDMTNERNRYRDILD